MFALHVYDQECKVCGVERGYVIYMGDRGDQAT
jgi:hypothetical protein